MAKMVEKVTAIMSKPESIRNIAICAHIDHGKTTFSDNLLWGAGMMSEELAGKALVLDYHEDEQLRGITIDAANVSMVHSIEGKEFLVNLIDTPGHVDFSGDVTRAMRAVDGAIVLVCAVEGVMPQTETVLRQALKERVKPILFINKVDRLIKELKLSPEAMQERFARLIAHVNKLIMHISEEEYGKRWQVSVDDGSVCFGSAYHNWGLSIPYMKRHKFTFNDIIDSYDDETWTELKTRAPIHQVVLDAVVAHLPNPIQAQKYRIPKIWRGDLDSKDGISLVSCDAKGPLYFSITKIVVDPQAGEIAAGRIFAGTMKKGLNVYLNRAKQSMKVQQVFIFNGAKREIVDNVPAGNIIGISGLKTFPGETITLQPSEPLEQISYLFEPVVTKAIEAKRPSDLPRLIEALKMVSKEDPQIRVYINEETGEHLMSGMGELHLEIIENRIKKDKGVEIMSSPPVVVYRESVTKRSSVAEGHSPNKQNMIRFIAEPLEPKIIAAIKKGDIPEGRLREKKDDKVIQKFIALGHEAKTAKGIRCVYHQNILIDETHDVPHINEVSDMLIDLFEDVMRAGPIAKEPCFGVKIRMIDCRLHEDASHRGPAQMYPALREGIRGAMRHADAVLYEPIQTLRFESPAEYMGEISKLVANKRGQLIDMTQENETAIIKAKLPVAEMFGLSNELRSATGGRGSSSVIDQSFERLPEDLQEKVILKIRERKGLRVEDFA